MPNHITNRLVIEGATEEVAKVFDFIKCDTPDEDGKIRLVDFNKIVPMPEELDISSSSEGEDGQKYLLGLAGNVVQIYSYKESEHYKKMEELRKVAPEIFDRCIEFGKQYLRNIANHGCTTWYEWRCRNWGTKWNAYEIEKVSDNEIKFQTAWSGVPALISNLAKKFHAVTIKYDYADEDISYNVGSYIFNGEKVENYSPENDSPEAWKLVFDLGVADIDDYVEQPDGTYEYKDED